VALEAWNSFYELGSFKLREITLNRPFALAQATRDRLLRWERIIVGIPPMLKELRENGELNGADLQPPLRLQQQVRNQRESRVSLQARRTCLQLAAGFSSRCGAG
jgi:hypothetical protein